ncbi:MAG: Dph6-related ATP pyrophosphatase [Planctomycetota bacterium]|jgi:uncharacterized protein (TIGR00290 family)
MKESVLFCWSGGKDSALALWEIQKRADLDVAALLTTVTEPYDRISMHGVREDLLDSQQQALGLPLRKIRLGPDTSDEDYRAKMADALEHYRKRGIELVAFGDIFLEDVRQYREKHLSEIGMKATFPLWGRSTTELAGQFIEAGFEAIITCVDSQALDRSFAGRPYDRDLLRDLPAGVDPCAENGEFHSFVYNGPIFAEPIPFETGDIVLRNDRFWYCDLLAPQDQDASAT